MTKRTYEQNFTENYIVAYGITGTVSDVDADKTYDYNTPLDIKATKVVYNVDLDMNNKKITNMQVDTNDNNSAATVEYVNLKTTISNTPNYDYREFFDVVIDFTNASTYELNQGSSGFVINTIGGKIQINYNLLDLQHISADGLNCKAW